MARSALLQSAHIARSGGLSEEQLAGLSEALKDFDGTEEDWVRVLKYEYHKAEYRKYKSKAWTCRVESLSLFRFCLSVTRLVVALNRYEMRNGKLPERLEQLVPEYIDSVPRDPYDGKPFRYDRNKFINLIKLICLFIKFILFVVKGGWWA